MKSSDLLRVQGYVVLPCRPFIGGANISSSGSQAATALWYSKDTRLRSSRCQGSGRSSGPAATLQSKANGIVHAGRSVA